MFGKIFEEFHEAFIKGIAEGFLLRFSSKDRYLPSPTRGRQGNVFYSKNDGQHCNNPKYSKHLECKM